MEVSSHDLERLPVDNLRVSRAEFAAVRQAAERRSAQETRRHVTDWHAGGVVVTCRWLAQAAHAGDASGRLERSPVTERLARADAERIEEECLAAERLLLRRPRPAWLQARPGWIEAVVATFDWAWRGTGSPPLPPGGGAGLI